MKGSKSIGKNKLWFKDGIFYFEFVDGKITKESAVQISEEIEKEMLSLPWEKRFLVVDLGNTISVSSEARKYFTDTIEKNGMVKMAMVFRNPVAKIIASFFVRLNRPKTQIKLFSDIDDATEWIRG